MSIRIFLSRVKRVFSVLLLLTLTSSIQGQVKKVTVNPGAWSTLSTWNEGVAPVDGDTVIIRHAITGIPANFTTPLLEIESNLTLPNTDGTWEVGKLILISGDFNVYRANITFSDTALIQGGRLIDSHNNGSLTFQGLLRVLPGAEVIVGTTSPFTFHAGIENHGTFSKTGAGNISFLTGNQDISGTGPISMAGNFSIQDGIEVTNSLAAGLNLTGILNGTGPSAVFMNNGVLSYSSATQPMVTGVFDVATPGNLVRYTLGNQAIRSAIYDQLLLSGTGTKTLQGAITVNSDFSTSGSTAIACLTHNLTLNGPVNHTSTGAFTTGVNVVTYGYTGPQQVIAATYSGSLLLSGSGIKTLMGNTSVTGTIMIQTGADFRLNGFNLNASNDITISDGAVFRVGAGSVLSLANTRRLINEGFCYLVGSPGNPATLTRIGATGNYQVFQSVPGAVFHARDYQLLHASLVSLTSGAIDPVNNFSNGEFSYNTGSESLFLTGIDLSGLPVVDNVIFNSGPSFNVTRTAGVGVISFQNASGPLAGENLDNDNGNPGTLINWTYPALTYYSNPLVAQPFSAGNPLNWTRYPDGTGGSPADIAGGNLSLILQTGHQATLDDAGGDMNVNELTINGEFGVGSSGASRMLSVQSLLRVQASGQFRASSSAAPAHVLQVYGRIENDGLFLLRDGAFTMNTEIIGISSHLSGMSMPTFNHFTLAVGARLISTTGIQVQGNVVIENTAIWNDGGMTHQVSGNWTENGTGARTGEGTVVFAGIVNQVSGTSPVEFHHVMFAGGGAATLNVNTVFGGNLTITNSTICSGGNFSLTYLGDYTLHSGSSFSHTANTSVFGGVNTQVISIEGAANFYNLTFSNGDVQPKTVNGNLLVNNIFTISTNALVNGAGSHTVSRIRLDGACQMDGQITLTAGGSPALYTGDASGPKSLGNLELIVQGNAVLGFGAPATRFDLETSQSVRVNSGYLVLADNTTLTNLTGNDLQLLPGTGLYVRGASNFPTGFAGYLFSKTSTVYYDVNLPQTIVGGLTYGNLNISQNTKSANGLLDIRGGLNFINAGTITILELDGHDISVSGNITNANVSTISGAGSTLTLSAEDADQSVSIGTYILKDVNIPLDMATTSRTKTFTQGANLQLSGDFRVSNLGGSDAILHTVVFNANTLGGTPVNFHLGAYCRLNTSAADFGATFMDQFTGVKELDAESTVHYYSGNQLVAHGFDYGNIMFSGTANKTAGGNLRIKGSIGRLADTPRFIDGGFTHQVSGNWLLSTAHCLPANMSGTIILDGFNQEITGTNLNNLTIANAGQASLLGALNLSGNLLFNNSSNLNADIHAITIGGNWINPGDGIFNQEIATSVTFNGASTQTIQSNPQNAFGSVIINKPNPAGSQEVRLLTDVLFGGNVTISQNAGVLNLDGKTSIFSSRLNVNANTVEPGSTFLALGSRVVFDGSLASQRILNYHLLPLTFHHVEFSGAADKTFAKAGTGSSLVLVEGNLTNNGSEININSWGGGSSAVDIEIKGDWTNTGSLVAGTTRTVSFTGANQQIGSSTFPRIVFGGTATKTLLGAITVQSNLTILGGATLDANGQTIAVSGNWDNAIADGVFLHGNGLVIFESAGSNINTGSSSFPTAGKGFHDLNISLNLGSSATLLGWLDVANKLEVSNGILVTGVHHVRVGGDFVIGSSGIFNHNNNASILTLTGNNGTRVFDPGPNNNNFRAIRVDAPASEYIVQNNFRIDNAQNLTIQQGAFRLNGMTLSVLTNNNRILLEGGELDVSEGSTISFANNTQGIYNNGGVLKIVGTSANPAVITKTGGTYTINQSAGIIHAGYYRIDQASGTYLTGGSIDATYNFSDGLFSNGTTGAGSAYLFLSGLDFSDFTASNVVFQAGPVYNVSRTTGNGTLTFADASGARAGEAFEQDNGVPGTLINWVTLGGFYWTGLGGDDNWHNPSNWSSNLVPDETSNVYLDHRHVVGEYQIRVHEQHARSSRLIIDAAGGSPIQLEITNGYELETRSSLNIGIGNTLSITDPSSLLKVGGNWLNQGTFNPGTSKVVLNGAPGLYTITPGGIVAGKQFYDLDISAPGARYTFTQPVSSTRHFSVLDGIVDVGANANHLYVGGDFLVNSLATGELIPRGNTLFLNGSNQQFSCILLNNLDLQGSGIKVCATNVQLNGSLVIGAGTTLQANESTLYLRLNWTNNGDFQQSGLGAVIFNGTGTQEIDNGLSTTTFRNIITQNGGEKRFNSSSIVTGDFTITPGSGVLDLRTYTIDGLGTSNSFIVPGNSRIRLRGEDNFPTGFENISLAPNSTVEYISDLSPQTVRMTSGWSYGNLDLRTPGLSISTKWVNAGDLIITGNLIINDTRTLLDMASSGANMVLTGTITFPSGGQQVNWGTGGSTLTHVGGDWNISQNILGFNHLVLGGTGNKWMQGNLAITGNVAVKTGVYLRMYQENNTNNFRVMMGIPGRTFTMEDGGRVYCPRPASSGPAIPEGFSTYLFGANSNYYLITQNAVHQDLFTGSGIQYGNLNFNGTKNVTSDGLATLFVKGSLNFNTATYLDNGRNIIVTGPDIYLNQYTASAPGVVLTLNGNGNQYLRDVNTNNLRIGTLVLAGAGSKVVGENNGNDLVSIAGNLTIQNGVHATTNCNLQFNGSTWLNNGIFRHTNRTLTFNSPDPQSIYPGVGNPDNYFSNLVFSGLGVKTFFLNGADVNGTFTIQEGMVDLAAFTHFIGGTITNTTGGVMLSHLANLVFDGGNQNINSPAFAAAEVTIKGTGTKRLFSPWSITNDVIIESGATLNTSDGTLIHNISLGGNWINRGTFTSNTATVLFNGSTSPVDIFSGGSNFHRLEFNPSAPVVYTLESSQTRVRQSMWIGSNANLNLNSKELILGANLTSGKLFEVDGTINVNADAVLKFNNQGSQSVLNVAGRLNLVGSGTSAIATLTREVAGIAGAESRINILSGATFAARYYLIEYLQDVGMNLEAGSILDPVNNLSDGTWSNIRAVANATYLTLESDYSGGTIQNVCFNFSGTPTQGLHFNVRRNLAVTPITFEAVTGNLGTYQFEDDDEVIPSASSGLLRWPSITLSNWTGAINSNWHLAGNWDNGVPDALMDAIIPNRPNNPVITDGHAFCKNLVITNGNLVIDNGLDVHVSSDITIGTLTNVAILAKTSSASTLYCAGIWNQGVNGIFLHGGGTVVFNSPTGSATVSPRSAFHHLVFENPSTIFYLSGATVNVLGNLEVREGILQPVTNNYVLNLHGNFQANNSFNPIGGGVTSGIIRLVGDGTQVISEADLFNLTVSGTGEKVAQASLLVRNNTIIESTLRAETGCQMQFNGNMTIQATGLLDDGGEEHVFNGASWYGYGSHAGTGKISFRRTAGHQYLYGGAFHHLDIDCQGRRLLLMNHISVKGDLTVKQGIDYMYLYDREIIAIGTENKFQMEPGVRLYVLGANNFPRGFVSYELDASSTVYYSGPVNQQVHGTLYGNLYLNGLVTKFLAGDVGVQGNLTFTNSTLDVTENNYSITISGAWTNNAAAGGTFLARQGEVIFDGTGIQNISLAAASSNEFYDLVIDKPSSEVRTNSAVDYIIRNNLEVQNGRFHAWNSEIKIGGNMVATGGDFANSGRYTLEKTNPGLALIGVNGSTLNNLRINSPAGSTYQLQDDLIVNANFELIQGIFDGNSKTVRLGNGTTHVASIAGEYRVGAGGRIALGDGSSFNVSSSGKIIAVGNPSSVVTITRKTTGRYSFIVNGEIHAKYALFEFMNSAGIFINEGALIDPVNNFSYCTFTNGANNGPMLRIETSQSFIDPNHITEVSFPMNPGAGAFNARKITTTTGTVEFYNATGVFAGETFESDPNNLIFWTGPLTLTWNGSQNTDWFNALNWTPSFGVPIVPTGNENVFIVPSVNQPVITTHGARTGHLTIQAGAMLTLDTPWDDEETDLRVQGDIRVNGTLRQQTINDFIVVEGGWSRPGTGTAILNGTVTFAGNTAAKSINNGNATFFNLEITGTTHYQIASHTTVRNNFSVLPGAVFDVTATPYNLTVGGDFLLEGNFMAQTGTVTLNASSGPRSIRGGLTSLNRLTVNAPGVTYQMVGDLKVNQLITLTNGTLNLNGHTLDFGDGNSRNLTVNGALEVNGNSTLRLVNNARVIVNVGGIFKLVGDSPASPGRVTSTTPSGRYALEVNSGGQIEARYYEVSNLNANGITLRLGAIVDPVNNFSEGTFSNGAASGTYLRFENEFGGTDIQLNNVSFGSGALYNVTRTSGTDRVIIVDAYGPLGSFEFENDEGGIKDPNLGLILWTYVNTYVWTGALSTDWHTPGNWSSSLVPDITKGVIIPDVANKPVISNGIAEAKKIDLYEGSSLTIERNIEIATDLFFAGNLVANGNPTITLGNRWTCVGGTFDPGQSTVVFNGQPGISDISQESNSFYHIKIDADPGTEYRLTSLLKVSGDLEIIEGALNFNSNDVQVAGSFTNQSVFIPGTRSLVLNGTSGVHSFDAGGVQIYNFTIDAPGATYRLLSDTEVSYRLTISRGILDLSPDNGVTYHDLTVANRLIISGGNLIGRQSEIRVGENWQISGTGVFTSGNSKVVMVAASGTRSISPRISPFYHLEMAGTATYRLGGNTSIHGDLFILDGVFDASTYDINISGDWENRSVFLPKARTVSFTGASQAIRNSSTEDFYRLVVSNSGVLSLEEGSVRVQNQLVMSNGEIHTLGHTLTLGTSVSIPGTLVHTGGVVVGKFERYINTQGTGYLFPVGRPSVPNTFTLTPVAGLTPGSVIALFVSGDPGAAGLPLSESGLQFPDQFTEGAWFLEAANGLVLGNHDMNFSANGFMSEPFSQDTRVMVREGSGNWTFQGTHQEAVFPQVFRNAMSGLPAGGKWFSLVNPDCVGGEIEADQSLCLGEVLAPFTSVSIARGGSGVFSYTWQYHTNTAALPGSPGWVDIPSSNSPGLNLGTASGSMILVRKANSAECSGDRYSNILTISILPGPNTGPVFRKPNL
jgi:hypothetical protein